MPQKRIKKSAPRPVGWGGKPLSKPLSHNKKEFQAFFPRAMGMAGKAMRRRLNHNLALAGLSVSAEHAVVLINLHHHAGLTQQEIAELVNRHKASTTRLIDFLEERNLVKRVSDTADRRQKMIYLTAPGRKLLRKLKTVGQATEQEALKGINTKELQICKNVLWQVWQNMQELSAADNERFAK